MSDAIRVRLDGDIFDGVIIVEDMDGNPLEDESIAHDLAMRFQNNPNNLLALDNAENGLVFTPIQQE